MPTLRKHKAIDGSTTFTATVRVKGFKSHSKTFPTRAAAAAWSKDKGAQLQELRRLQGSAVTSDLPSLTVGDLVLKYLEDPEVKKLRSYDDLHRLLCEWIQDSAGAVRVLDANPLTWRQARDRLGRARGPATTNRYISGMRAAWNWARAAGLVPTDRIWPPKLMLREPRDVSATSRTTSSSDCSMPQGSTARSCSLASWFPSPLGSDSAS